jgi:hypothetical protein
MPPEPELLITLKTGGIYFTKTLKTKRTLFSVYLETSFGEMLSLRDIEKIEPVDYPSWVRK